MKIRNVLEQLDVVIAYRKKQILKMAMFKYM